MGRIEDLASRYKSHIEAPWQRNLAGGQKAIFVVYPKTDERRLRYRIGQFELATQACGQGWKLVDLTDAFAEWMADTDYRETYFEEPDSLEMELSNGFLKHAADCIREALTAEDVDENTVVAVQGVASLYGLTRVSDVLKEVVHDIQGRLVVFFPGEHDDNVYRLLDARDGWNYLAVPITLHNGIRDV